MPSIHRLSLLAPPPNASGSLPFHYAGSITLTHPSDRRGRAPSLCLVGHHGHINGQNHSQDKINCATDPLARIPGQGQQHKINYTG